MRPRTYRVDGHEIKFSVEDDVVYTVIDGKEWTDTNIRAAAVSIGADLIRGHTDSIIFYF